VAQIRNYGTSGGQIWAVNISDIVYMNGSTDYVELWAAFNGTRTVYGGTYYTYLSVGLLIAV